MRGVLLSRVGWLTASLTASLAVLCAAPARQAVADSAEGWLESLAIRRGVCVVLGDADASAAIELARSGRLLVYLQLEDSEPVAEARRVAQEAGLLGRSLYVEQGRTRIPLADNLADGLIDLTGDAAAARYSRAELLRVVHPGARVLRGTTTLVKPLPPGGDDWSHPYHGPDNNPQSRDQGARAPYLTQFLSEPWYVPMPQVTVASGGRVFKAFGHIALKQREWPWMNTVVALNGYNGTILWRRSLKPGFMIHRNAFIATPDTLYVADDSSCKLLDADTGWLRDEIVVPKDVDAAGVWKWMALEGDVLYALVGRRELIDPVIRGQRTQPGWPWNTLGEAYAGEYSWGFGETLLAIDPASHKLYWSYRSPDPIDGRAICLADGKIFAYSHLKWLAAFDAASGQPLWRNNDPKLLAAIGQHDRAQTANKGFASSAYLKANDKGVYFAGPQRTRLVAVNAQTGDLMWDYPDGNFQLLLRDDGLYAMGRMQTSKKFDYLTGRVLADLECYRGNCTRATGTIDSIFTRGYRHTGTMRLDLTSQEPQRIAPMRPACQDGVIVSQGHLYWGPWMCDCNHSLVGFIGLAPAKDLDAAANADQQATLEHYGSELGQAARVADGDRDWRGYRRDPQRSASTPVEAPRQARMLWRLAEQSQPQPTAPVTAGDLVIRGDQAGSLRAHDIASGSLRWTAYTGGGMHYPPEVWRDRVYAGSGDGWVYCWEAASGRLLWRFRAAPADRRIMAHGKLMSTWPVGGGVLAYQGVIYAAAGIASYDGTHVYALDAETGQLRWRNDASGNLAEGQHVTGVSVQGHLLLHEGRLYLAGGNVVSPAVYDARDGRCLNRVDNQWLDAAADTPFPTPDNPQTEMFRRSPRGSELVLVNGQVQVFGSLLYAPPGYQESRYLDFGGKLLQAADADCVIRAVAGKVVRVIPGAADQTQPTALWQYDGMTDPCALALCPNAVLLAGQTAPGDGPPDASYRLMALAKDSGRTLWSLPLPSAPADWGLAVDRQGRILVSLVDGDMACYGAAEQ